MALEITRTPDPMTGQAGVTRVPKRELGKDDFLILLTKQLQNQDPMNPVENTEFVAQMANFSTLEQITNMGKSLDKFLANSADQIRVQAMQLLGRNVTAALPDVPEPVSGPVSKVRFVDGDAVFTVDDYDVLMSQITSIDAGERPGRG